MNSKIKYQLKRFFTWPYRAIKASILCIRFPFLYPRNRFDGKHHTYFEWIHCLLAKYRLEAIRTLRFSYQFYKDPADCKVTNTEIDTSKLPSYIKRIYLDLKGTLHVEGILRSYTFDLAKHVGKDFTITGITFDNRREGILTYHCHRNEIVKDNYGFGYHHIDILVNETAQKKIDFIKKVDNFIDKLCFIPTYTELDAMPDGWRKVFGIQICKEIKQQLKKDNALYDYRILQIKEKFAELRWYSLLTSDEIEQIIDKYAAISSHICIHCGKPATKYTLGYILPYCDDCCPKERKYEDSLEKAFDHGII